MDQENRFDHMEVKLPLDKEGRPLCKGLKVTLELEVCDVLSGQHVEVMTERGERITIHGSLLKMDQSAIDMRKDAMVTDYIVMPKGSA